MRLFLLSCLSLMFVGTSFAQKTATNTIQYGKNNNPINVSKEKTTTFSFEIPPDTQLGSTITLLVRLNGQSISWKCPITIEKNKVKGQLNWPILDENKTNHIAFGKAIIKHLYSHQDSLITFHTQVQSTPDIQGKFILNFKQGNGLLTHFMTFVEYQYWVEKMQYYQALIVTARKDSIRASALFQQSLGNKKAKAQIANGTKQKLNKYAKYNLQFDEINKITLAIDDGLQKVRNGLPLSKEETLIIADATGQKYVKEKDLEKSNSKAFQCFQTDQKAQQDLRFATLLVKQHIQLVQERNSKLKTIRTGLNTATQKTHILEKKL